ncbi:hypothetical protein FBU30_000085 [Linnemannia zychae]|nr:hypothetical protein FBU30_000085 [Linnemannia zychae]
MDKPVFSSGGYGVPPPQPLPQQQQQQQQQQFSLDNVGHGKDPQRAAIQQALDAFVQQSKEISAVDMDALVDHLQMLMKDCSQANIQAGKNWVIHFCQNPQQYDLLMRAMVSIAISRKTFEEKLHIIYLTNDVLSHCERKQQQWIKNAIHPHLVPLLRVAYFFPGTDDAHRQRVIKVLDIWRNREFFPPSIVDSMEMNVKRPPLLPNNGQGSGTPSSNDQWQLRGQVPPFPPPAHSQPQLQPPPQFQHHQQQPFPQQQPFQPPYPPQYPGFQHHPQHPQIHNQAPFPHPPNSQQMPLHNESWAPPPGAHPGYPPFHGNTSIPQHPPHGAPPPQFHHPPNSYPQAPPYHNQQSPFQQQHIQLSFPHGPRNVPMAVPARALTPPPPEPTHKDVLTRDLPAGQMASRVEVDADYYEPLPAYISVPIHKKVYQDKDLLDKVAEFVREMDDINVDQIAKGDEGWHEGQLDEFYKSHGEKRNEAFSKNPRSRRNRQHSPHSDQVGHDRGEGLVQGHDRTREVDLGATRQDIVEAEQEAEVEVRVGAEAEAEVGAEEEAVLKQKFELDLNLQQQYYLHPSSQPIQ